ncbi:MAG: Argininosuccinate lyase [uncultured Nocardioidaceae bacterium]|uniref:Argininosuccinate lyase n=1 Tax=uncultured Nocardioidaceae bacterium TaxID=253824 RepID=A0A6J4MW41_9ACTN|nr:MAG: Argininosuccinate lyase [uncultured Nocardioidaceae bacterium]
MPPAENESISRHRLSAPPGPVYTRTVLEPSFRFMLDHYFEALLETNRAWALMLGDTGIVPGEHVSRLLAALDTMASEGAAAFEEFNPAHEYFYSHLENRLSQLAGPDAAGQINVARTRPEPLTRMALRVKILRVSEGLAQLTDLLLDLAEREADTVMPQWTHMQPAQPSTLGHYVLGIVDALDRDAGRIESAYRTTNACTLGCGALAGTSYPIDRLLVTDLLGFDDVRVNTIDCVASGDFALETTAALANLATTLSRLCEDLYLWHTDEFALVEIGDAFAGSSSMMPQKKNAYPFEYVRARAAHAVGDMVAAFGALHNTNFGDIKDVEEEMVPPTLHSCEEVTNSLELLTGTLGSLTVHRERMADRAAAGFSTATELAAVLHRETDLDFRTAHRVVGRLVGLAVQRGIRPQDVGSELLDEAAGEVLGREAGLSADQVRRALDPHGFIAAHTVLGGPAPEPVRSALADARARAERRREWHHAATTRLATASEELRRRADAHRADSS